MSTATKKSVFQHQLPDHKVWVLLGHLLFLSLLVLSIVYYRERMLAMDTAYYSFRMIIEDGFYTGHERYISYFPQLLPLAVLKLGGSLQLFLLSYSMSFILFYYVVYNIVVYLFRNVSVGLFFALAMCLTIRYKFYAPVGESVMSIAYLALLLGWLSRPDNVFNHLPTWLDIAIGCCISALMYTAHPMIAIATFFSLGFHLFYQQDWKNARFWGISIFTGALLYYRFVFRDRGSYEQARADRLNDALAVLTNYQDYYVYEMVAHYFQTHYFLGVLLFLLSLIGLARAKHFLLSIYILLSSLLVLAVVIIAHAYLSADIYNMIDGYMTYVGAMWALAIAFVFVQKNRWWMAFATAIVLVFSVYKIKTCSTFFADRLAYLQTAIEQHTSAEYPKSVAYMTDMNYEKLWIGWAMSCETLLLSTLNNPEDCRTIYLANQPGELAERIGEVGTYWNVNFGLDYVKLNHLNKRFFKLPDTAYREVKLE